MRAIEPGDDAHILDVCPELWPRVLEWLDEAAASPETVLDGSHCLRTRLQAGGLRVTPREPPTPKARSRRDRGAIDLERIRAALAADSEVRALVLEMLTAACTAMAAGVRNHAAEFVGDGRFTKDNIPPQLRADMAGTPITSVMAETMFARVKRRADRGGVSRHDTRMGAVLCERDGTVAWLRNQKEGERLWRLARRRWRKGSGAHTMQQERECKGEAKALEREAKLEKVRCGRAKKAAEAERVKGVQVLDKYSALKGLHNDELSDQLKYYKIVEGKKGFRTTGSRAEMVATLQLFIFEKFGASANDLADGDSGVDKESDGRRRRRKINDGTSKSKGKKKKKNVVSLHGWEWDSTEEFIIERCAACPSSDRAPFLSPALFARRLIGKMVADGSVVPGHEGQEVHEAGTVLYKVLWQGFPPEVATWEEEDDIPCGEVDYVGEYEAALAAEDAEDEDQQQSSA